MDPKLALTHLSASDVPLRLLLARTVLSLCGATLPTALHSPIALALLLALALPRAGVLVLTAASTHWGTLAPRYAANVLGSWRFSPEVRTHTQTTPTRPLTLSFLSLRSPPRRASRPTSRRPMCVPP
jgi:hypothetical protein